MSTLELNKIVAAVLVAGIIAMMAGFASRLIVHPKSLAQQAYPIQAAESAPSAGGAQPAAADKLEPIAPLLAAADVKKGEAAAKKCGACHTFADGGKNLVGPNLWNVVNKAKAQSAGFAYSDAMKKSEGAWSYESLNHLIWKPNDYVKGTKMAFAGIRNTQERADLVAYLRTLSANPAPLP
ncbi:MAG: cytochrome c family protein [Alphaproteobacteria bacterium]|nr:cytochrome c family protein [Alphaproteobacteria bacterium]